MGLRISLGLQGGAHPEGTQELVSPASGPTDGGLFFFLAASGLLVLLLPLWGLHCFPLYLPSQRVNGCQHQALPCYFLHEGADTSCLGVGDLVSKGLQRVSGWNEGWARRSQGESLEERVKSLAGGQGVQPGTLSH